MQAIDAEHDVANGRELHLSYRVDDAHPVPAVLLLPHAPRPAPGAILLHGYSSRKEHMSGPIGGAMLARGVASLAIDLPLHGTRADPVQQQSARNPLMLMQLWRQALADARLGIHYLAARAELDRTRLGVVGYSMGSFMAVTIAADEPLMVHGRHDRTVLPEQAQRLFDAALEPKRLDWWDAGHRLPHEATDGAADWLAEQLS